MPNSSLAGEEFEETTTTEVPSIVSPAATDGTSSDFKRLLKATGRQRLDRLSLVNRTTSGHLHSRIHLPADAVRIVAEKLAAGDCYYGTAVLHERVTKGRGTARDVIAVRTLYADLDYKPGALTEETALKVTNELSTMLGVAPVAIVHSGGGIQPYWRLERSDGTDWTDETSPQHAATASLLRRWGRLVRHVAETNGGTVDSVFDLARVLRVPGTRNTKYDPARLVTVELPGGAPVSLARLAETLDTYGVAELSGDRELLGKTVAPPDDWKWSQRTCRYVTGGMVAGWENDTPVKRHPWLMGQAVRLAAAHRAGCVTQADHEKAVEALAERFETLVDTTTPRRPVAPGEVTDALSWGIAKAATFVDQARALKELGDHDHLDLVEPVDVEPVADDGPPMEPDDEDEPPPEAGERPSKLARYHANGPDGPGWYERWDGVLSLVLSPEKRDAVENAFWTARPELAHVRTFAQAQMASPWGVLAYVLARVVCHVPPVVVLPAVVFGHASLNLTLALVADSGGGKGGCDSVAKAAVRQRRGLPLGQSPFDEPPVFVEHTLGSGHGIAHAYGYWDNKAKTVKRRAHDAVLLTVEEVDLLAGLDAQTGSTTLAELRRFGMGEKLGHLFVANDRRIEIPAHTYRGAVIVSVQPGRAAVILDAADGGTPQRFYWVPASDRNRPKVRPARPAPWEWELPKKLPEPDQFGLRPIQVCQAAADAIVKGQEDRLDGKSDALDGHALLTRERVAAALGVLNGHYEVTDEDWRLAGTAIKVSDATRKEVVDTLKVRKQAANVARGQDDAVRAVIVEETVDKANLRRVAKLLQSKLTREWVNRSELRRSGLANRDRGYFDPAIERLVDVGTVEVEDTGRDDSGHGGRGVRYRLAKESS
jgi:hypothetical protein